MKCKLSDIVNLKIGRTPPRKEPQWFCDSDEGIKWVSIKDMGACGKHIYNTSEWLTKDAVKKFNVPVVEKNTILLSFKLTVGRVCITTENMVTNEAIAQLPIKDQRVIDRDYLYYFLKNYNFRQLGSTSSIATAVNSNYLKNIEIQIPPIEAQKAIASILSKLDDKIELNNAINNNLAA